MQEYILQAADLILQCLHLVAINYSKFSCKMTFIIKSMHLLAVNIVLWNRFTYL